MKNKMEVPILPAQVFFNPTHTFLKWAKKNLKGSILIDCGAGTGRLSHCLKLQGLSVVAIDICEREKCDTLVLQKDSTTFPFPPKGVAIIARPSRGDWIQDTIYHALETCSYVLYIGIEEHIGEDIESLSLVKVEKVFDEAGEDGEMVYRISKNGVSTMKKYFLVKREAAPKVFMVSWHEEDGDKWVNFNGGWCPKSKKDKILETVEANDIHDLDWRKTDLVNNSLASGWLDREGRFTGCHSQAHDLVADLVFNKSVEEMENAGMVRIYDKELWACEKRMSPEQRNYMLHKGFDISRDEVN